MAKLRMQGPLLAPSVLSADFSKLGDEVAEVEAGGADWLHVDVMDGHFVPNLTIGPLVVAALRGRTALPLDCHLMVSRPEDWVEEFSRAGADLITVHWEAATHLDRLLQRIRELGCKAGVSINPATPVSLLAEVLDRVDLVLLMSVNPGFGGQAFIPGTLKKVEELKALRGAHPFLIEVDGGVSEKNIRELRRAGADVFVAGSAVFGKKDRAQAIRELKGQF
jgi:ribulose-phosphate 3-epimerase